MSDEKAIDKWEPCEKCGDSGDSRLYWPTPEKMVVWCWRCIAEFEAARLAVKEAALLADWGKQRDRRAS